MVVLDNKNPKVSIIIVNWNCKHLLKACLASVFNQTYKNYEVILVDNASTDGSVEYVKKEFPKTKIIVNEKNLGWAGGNNIGIEKASGELIVLLNPDTIVRKNWLEELVKAVMSNEKVGAACSQIIGAKKIGTINVFGFCILTSNVPEKIKPIFVPDGCSIIFKKKYLTPPVFDSDYFMYNDEIYFGWRMRLRGYEVVYVPSSMLYHLGGGCGEKAENEKIRKKIQKLKSYYNDRNRILNLLIFYESTTLLKLLPLLIPIFIFRVFSDPINKFKIILYLIRNVKTIIEKRRKIQNERRVPDREILKYMTCKLIEGDTLFVRIANKFNYLWCRLMGIYTQEFYS